MSNESGTADALTGRCLCRALRWPATGRPIRQAHCHCKSCRRATSSAVAAIISIPRNGFASTGAAPAAFASSQGARRRFCGACGAPLSYESADHPGEAHLYAATLDDPTRARPEKHDFRDERVPWLPIAGNLPHD